MAEKSRCFVIMTYPMTNDEFESFQSAIVKEQGSLIEDYYENEIAGDE